MISGARQGTLSGLRRLLAATMARDLKAFLIPGPDLARAHGLDIKATGLQAVASPRHASVLLVIGAIPLALNEAAAVIYAQMPRPRALFALGTETSSPLPVADVITGLSQQDLIEGVHRLRRSFAEEAFHLETSDFDAAVLQVHIEYTCPMHADVIQSEPGACPKCGMNLVVREARDPLAHKHTDMDHGDMDHSSMAFMSMIEVTKDLPRSSDGLPMEWLKTAFGPFFPGLPAGLLLSLTLDGDTVAGSDARCLTENPALLQHSSMNSADFVEQLAAMDPLAPVAYRLLACRALENVAGIDLSADTARARSGALERERIVSHLGWLALFAEQTGFDWLKQHATSLQLKFQHTDQKQIVALKPTLHSLIKRLQHTPLLKSRTADIGRLAPDTALRGPVARASGIGNDARSMDRTFTMLGFSTISRREGDAFARLQIRLDEITQSLALIDAAGAIELPALAPIGEVSARGEAVVETARGLARLQLTLETGQITALQLETPSTHHLTLINPLIEQLELGDALVAAGSLDLSPWEIQA